MTNFISSQPTPDNSSKKVQSHSRFYYMDNLRALAMLLGIFFHAALAYVTTLQELWLAADPANSEVIGFIVWFTHTFRMPLFFIIAGFFSFMLIEKRGTSAYLKHRLKRIGIPFLIFTPLCILSVIFCVGWAIENIDNPSPMLMTIISSQDNPDSPPQPFSTMHLWFLFNLLLFCFSLWGIAKTQFFNTLWLSTFVSRGVMVFIFPLFMVPALLTQPAPLPAPERIYPELWSFGYYGLLFFMGVLLFKKQSILIHLRNWTLPMLLASVALYLVYYSFIPESLNIEDLMTEESSPYFSLLNLTKAALEAYLAVWMSLVCIVLSQRLLDRQNRVLAYISRSSYWIYIMHLPVLFWVQLILLDYQLHFLIEFCISVIATLMIGIVSYQLFVANTIVGRLLNGAPKP